MRTANLGSARQASKQASNLEGTSGQVLRRYFVRLPGNLLAFACLCSVDAGGPCARYRHQAGRLARQGFFDLSDLPELLKPTLRSPLLPANHRHSLRLVFLNSLFPLLSLENGDSPPGALPALTLTYDPRHCGITDQTAPRSHRRPQKLKDRPELILAILRRSLPLRNPLRAIFARTDACSRALPSCGTTRTTIPMGAASIGGIRRPHRQQFRARRHPETVSPPHLVAPSAAGSPVRELDA